MQYKFVEIGSCDFNTQCHTLSNDREYGICVDPIRYYLDNLPSSPNLFKENSAISNKVKNTLVYTIPENIIYQYNLPLWLKGCSKIDSMHPTAINELRLRQLPLDLIHSYEISTITYGNLIEKYNCIDIEYLKIDTEGNEPDIIDSLYEFYSSQKKYNRPRKINIEAFVGILVEEASINRVKNQLFSLDYKIIEINNPDIIFKLK